MSEGKDSAIKLFGKAIPLPPPPPPVVCCDSGGAGEDLDSDEALSCERQSDTTKQLDYENHNLTLENARDQNEAALADDNPKTPTTDNESPSSKALKNEEEQSDTYNSQDKTLKKPNKILPCPRCDSMDTKFCYYNNYNVNQPRHFCKNCQRYWTAGGTMRNVPVGAGRRKSKNSAPQDCHFSISQALQNAPNGAHYPTLRPNGTVLAFGSDTPLSESIADQNMNEFHKPEKHNIFVPNDQQSSMFSVTAANTSEENGKYGPNNAQAQNFHSYPPQVPFFAGGPPWPYLLNMPQWVPPPGVIPPGYPMPFYPAPPYWGYAVPPPRAIPFVNPPLSTSPNSHTLGKHCRDESMDTRRNIVEDEGEEGEKCRERSLWMPKTLRIDDLGEAAKNSIWATLGIKPENCNSSSGVGGKGELFKAFRSKASDNLDTSSLLQANPAALSRSRNFQENS